MRKNKDDRQDKRRVEARLLLHLPDIISDRHVVSVDAATPDGEGVVILSTDTPPDYRSPDNRFAKAHGVPNRFRVDYWTPNFLQSVALAETPQNFHSAQPLRGNEWLLTCHRARKGEPNGVVYSENGAPMRSFFLGDGIESVQTTPNGEAIWVSYFDEGVYGGGELEQNGLVCFDRDGSPVLRFASLPHGDLDVPTIDDCYALNVVSDTETWVYYYNAFPLVRIQNGVIVSVMDHLKMSGSKAFAICLNRTLFGGGYDDSDALHLMILGGDRNRKKIIHPITEGGDALPVSGDCFARGRFFYLPHDGNLYVLELDYDL